MKNTLLMLAFVTGISVAHSQEFSLGPIAGANFAWASDLPIDQEGLFGLNAGATLVYSNDVRFGLGLDLRFSGEGFKTELNDVSAKTSLNYIRIPVKLIGFFKRFEDNFRPKLYFGPSMGFLVGGKTEVFTEVGTAEFESKDYYENFDLGLTFGTGFNYRIAPRTWLNFDIAYTHGILDIVKDNGGDEVYNRSALATVGVAWGL